jgi:hypothetical protein
MDCQSQIGVAWSKVGTIITYTISMHRTSTLNFTTDFLARGKTIPDWWQGRGGDYNEYLASPDADRWKVGLPTGGYCVHGSPLFLIWHRPYLALLEQMLQITAKHFADMQNDPATRLIWQKEAERLRLPYWDFGRPNKFDGTHGYADHLSLKYGMPAPLALKYVRVKRPNSDVYENILNPLYSYTYPTDATIENAYPGFGYGLLTNDENNRIGRQLNGFLRRTTPAPQPAATARWPDRNGQTQMLALERQATQTVDIQRMRVFYTITNVKSFTQVSCSTPIKRETVGLNAGKIVVNGDEIFPGYTASLENIHDDYHTMIGGTSMRDVPAQTFAHTGVDISFRDPSPDGLVQPVIQGGGTLTPPETAGFEPGFWMMHGFYEYTQCLWQVSCSL